jgi:hypothetical protein
METLTRNNYEIWFVDYLDGKLGNEQLDTLLDFLEQNPDLKQELLGVSDFRLEAGTESLDQRICCLRVLLISRVSPPLISFVSPVWKMI